MPPIVPLAPPRQGPGPGRRGRGRGGRGRRGGLTPRAGSRCHGDAGRAEPRCGRAALRAIVSIKRAFYIIIFFFFLGRRGSGAGGPLQATHGESTERSLYGGQPSGPFAVAGSGRPGLCGCSPGWSLSSAPHTANKLRPRGAEPPMRAVLTAGREERLEA